eukprot:TRINITY_DN5562_c0_g3_i1.p1 TRINITY_DN5562_c0_g3~~TRINITY_DN5562_c0_g3_i1.p1  ORF type:complete len:107 (-),score=27.56 TRINITY_DN5562_c0_g3_i1:195-515(-)
MQATEAAEKIEELNIVNKEFSHLIGIIKNLLPEELIESSEENAMGEEVAKDDQIIEVPHRFLLQRLAIEIKRSFADAPNFRLEASTFSSAHLIQIWTAKEPKVSLE